MAAVTRSLLRSLFGRATPPIKTGSGEAAQMVAELSAMLPADAQASLGSADELARLSRNPQSAALAAWFGRVEDALAAPSADPHAFRLEFRRQAVRRWPSLASHEDFKVALSPPSAQQATVTRFFLREVWKGARDVLGAPEGSKLAELGRWLDSGFAAGEPSPFSGSEEGGPEAAATACSRGLHRWLDERLGRRADSIYEKAYQSTARQYGALDEFPAALGLMPEKLLTADKLGLLRRGQIEQVLREKIALLESANVDIARAKERAETALIELEAAQANLIHSEKMASLGQMTAGIAHEIKNPLNFVNNFATLSVELLDELKAAAGPAMAVLDESRRDEFTDLIRVLTSNLHKIAEHGRRADGIVKSMLAHSRGGGGERRMTDINAIVEDALNLAFHGARAKDPAFDLRLERDYDGAMSPLELSPHEIGRVFLNLFGNGFYAATLRKRQTDDPSFEPTLKTTTRDLGNSVEVRVWDNGIGMAPEVRNKLFQPFFTTKPTGEGTGLGLSVSYEIVVGQHGGQISAASRPGEFSEFTVRLPRRQSGGAVG